MKTKLDTEQKAAFKQLRADTPGIKFFHAGITTIAYARWETVHAKVNFATCVQSDTSKKWREYDALLKFVHGKSVCLAEYDFNDMLETLLGAYS